MSINIKQQAKYNDDGLWSWSVFLEGEDNELDRIEEVVYVLHPTYNRPVRRISDRQTNFRLDEEGWSSFALSAEVRFKDGAKQNISYNLDLSTSEDYPKVAGPINSSFEDRLQAGGAKKLLSLDGGGTRSVITIEILSQIEALLRSKYSRPELVLSDFFDYICSTSFGSFIACMLSMGMSTSDIREFYTVQIPFMFTKTSLLNRLRYTYDERPFAERLRQLLGSDTTLGDRKLRNLLMIVVRNATTNEVWPLSNNPYSKYNDTKRPDCNLHMPLWQIVRASTAFPTLYRPEVVRVGSQDFVFVSGELSAYDNPAMLLFLMATAEPYRLKWPAQEDKLLLVSVGSGEVPYPSGTPPEGMSLLESANAIPAALFRAARAQQDLLCRMFSRCVVGPPVDREVGDLIGQQGPGAQALFTYVRYNPILDSGGLESLGLSDIRPSDIDSMDDVDSIPPLLRIGKAFSTRTVLAEHFEGFL